MAIEQVPASKRPPRVTIADVARAAGVSPSAVSFALNGRPGISAETRERILRVVDELGWRPSARARALANARAEAVGFIFSRPVELLAYDPFFSQFLVGLESVLSAGDHALVLQVIAGSEADEANAYRRMANAGRVDGFVLTDAREGDHRYELVRELGLPAVIVGDATPDAPFPARGSDVAAGTRVAVEHLLALGHRRIDHVAGPLSFVHALRRQEAWADAMATAGVTGGRGVEGDFTGPGGAAATARLLAAADPPTAIVYGNDLMAMAGMAVLRERGLSIPEDVSVIGYDDVPLATHTTPPLTTIRQDIIGNGRLVAASLLTAITGSVVASEPLRDPELVLRSTTGPPPGSAA